MWISKIVRNSYHFKNMYFQVKPVKISEHHFSRAKQYKHSYFMQYAAIPENGPIRKRTEERQNLRIDEKCINLQSSEQAKIESYRERINMLKQELFEAKQNILHLQREHSSLRNISWYHKPKFEVKHKIRRKERRSLKTFKEMSGKANFHKSKEIKRGDLIHVASKVIGEKRSTWKNVELPKLKCQAENDPRMESVQLYNSQFNNSELQDVPYERGVTKVEILQLPTIGNAKESSITVSYKP